MKLIIFCFFALISYSVFSKQCTESDIRNALSQHNSFDFDREGCSDEVVYVRRGIALSSNAVIDGRNRMRIDWKGDGSQCDEFPRNSNYAVFYTTGSNIVMKNFTILKSPEGIHLNTGSNNLVENVRFERICEDAITNGTKAPNPAKRSIVRNSVFLNGPDKAIQCNGGSMLVENSHFENIPRAIGQCSEKADPGYHGVGKCTNRCDVIARNNTIIGCRGYGFRSSGKKIRNANGTFRAYGNTFRDCSKPFKTEEDGYFYAEDNTIKGKCQYLGYNESSKGRIEVCQNDSSACKELGNANVRKQCHDFQSPDTNEREPAQEPNLEGIVSAIGSGGTTSGDTKAACNRAKDRAIDAVKKLCLNSTAQVNTSDCDCDNTSGKKYNCQIKASLQCDSTGSVPNPPSSTPPASENPPNSDEPPQEPDLDGIVSAVGSGGTTNGDTKAACNRAKDRAIDAVKKLCSNSDGNIDTSECDCSNTSGKHYTCKVRSRLQCSSSDGSSEPPSTSPPPSNPDPPTSSGPLKNVRVTKTIVITKPGTYDYKGLHHIWKGSGRCVQKENQPPILRIAASNVTVKNFSWEGAPDGIHVHCDQQNQGNRCPSSQPVRNVKLVNFKGHACEDLLTLGKHVENVSIIGGEFRPNPNKKERDKSFQLNFGKNTLIDGAKFIGGKRCIRLKSGAGLTIQNSTFDGCSNPIRGDSTERYTGLEPNKPVRIRSINNTYKNCDEAGTALDKGVKFTSSGDKFKSCNRGNL